MDENNNENGKNNDFSMNMESYDYSDNIETIPIDELLLKDTITLEEMLNLGDFVESLNSRNDNLLNFLKKPGMTESLIEQVVGPTTELGRIDSENVPIEIENQRRRSYIAFQALTTDVITEIMIEEYELLDKLFSFLDYPEQNDAFKNGYFSKIVLTIYEKYPAELFLYFSMKNIMVAKFVKNINNLFVMELLFKFIDSLSSHQWLADEHLILQLVALLDEEKFDIETQESAVRTLEIICNICSYCPYSVLVSQILETEEVTNKLLNYTLFESPSKDFRMRQGLSIVIQVLNLLHKDTESYENEPPEEEKKEIPFFVQQFTDKLSDFVNVLKTPSQRPSITNSSGIIPSPFGNTRLKVLEFVVGLMSTGFQSVFSKLQDLDVFKICLEIFFEYKWNNFIHHQVYLMMSRILSGDPNLIQTILEESKFIEKTLESFDKYDSSTVGYFGHLVELCNELISASSLSESLNNYLLSFDKWGVFISGKLEEINEICQTGPQIDDEEEDFNAYDHIPDQYYFGNQHNKIGLDDDEDDDKLSKLGKMLEIRDNEDDNEEDNEDD
eukprot:TRINITY_DN8146_c0_g1_i1.p1 TRINITY_DN8146_c0_g1~~TRINITY_DN8146_c0_g1_i1.p1  ORF type:complete len:557 (+),score=156.73 TRINITY_DN8146_c0_g1_i1:56-1726(+)